MPHGTPGVILVGAMHGMQLMGTPGLLVELTELNHDWRVVPTDGRAHKKDPDPLFNGDEVGRDRKSTRLQSHLNLVCRLLLEKKKNNRIQETVTIGDDEQQERKSM